MKNDLTQEYVKERLTYFPNTGLFIWKPIQVHNHRHAQWNKRYANTRAGTIRGPNGYRHIQFGEKGFYREARLAFLYMTGDWPNFHIDHANGEPGDNRWNNLRQASVSQNMANKNVRIDSRSKFKGVRKNCHKWESRIKVNGRETYLGNFSSPEEAHAAYVGASRILYGDFAKL